MRIGFVSPHYMPYKGGIETLVQAIAERMAAWGHQVDVLTLATSANLPGSQEVNRVMVRRFRERISGDAYPVGLPLLFYLLVHRRDYDVVNVHNYHALPLLWCNLAAVHPLVVSTHYHGQGHSRFANGLHPLYRPLGSWAVRHGQAVICASKFERDLVCAHLRVEKENIEIVPDGVALNALHAAKPLELGGTALLYVGRLEKYKRVDLAITSLCYLPEDFRLYIIGKGPEEEALRAQARQVKVDHRVEFMHDIPDELLYRWYRSACVLIMMSEAESFPMTSIEAVATGCRVVCSARSPFTELASQLPDAIFLLQDPTPFNLAQEVRRIACLSGRVEADLNKYDWDSIARVTLNIFEKVSTSKVGVA